MLTTLPPEILSEVFHRLDQDDLARMSTVNKDINSAVTPFLWRTIPVFTEQQGSKLKAPEALEALTRNCQYVRTLKVRSSDGTILKDVFNRDLIPRLDLSRLSISAEYFDDEQLTWKRICSLTRLLERNHHLHTLHVVHAPHKPDDTELLLLTIARSLPQFDGFNCSKKTTLTLLSILMSLGNSSILALHTWSTSRLPSRSTAIRRTPLKTTLTRIWISWTGLWRTRTCIAFVS